MKWALWVLLSALSSPATSSSLVVQNDDDGGVLVEVVCRPLLFQMTCERIFSEGGQQQGIQSPPSYTDDEKEAAANGPYFKCQVGLPPQLEFDLEQQTCIRVVPENSQYLQCSASVPVAWRTQTTCEPELKQLETSSPRHSTDEDAPLDLVRVTCAPAAGNNGQVYCSCSHGVGNTSPTFVLPYFDSLECRVQFDNPGLPELTPECSPSSLSLSIQGITIPIPFLRECSLTIPKNALQLVNSENKMKKTPFDLIQRATKKDGELGLVKITCGPHHLPNGRFTCKCDHGAEQSSKWEEFLIPGNTYHCKVFLEYHGVRELEQECVRPATQLSEPRWRSSDSAPAEVSPEELPPSVDLYTCSTILPKPLLPLAFGGIGEFLFETHEHSVVTIGKPLEYVPQCSYIKECGLYDQNFICLQDEDCVLCLRDLRKFFPNENIPEYLCRSN